MAENFQWSNNAPRNVSKGINFRLAAVLGVILLAFALPVTVLFLGNRQDIRQNASTITPSVSPFWSTNISASSSCPANSSTGIIAYSFKNTDTYTMTVTVKDLQTGKSVDLGQVAPGQTKSGQIDTGLTTLQKGTVQFLLSAPNHGNDVQTATYNAQQCHPPTSTPTPTPKPTLTPTPTLVPSSTPTPPVCQVNQAVCQWLANTQVTSYHYKVTDIASSGVVLEGDVPPPATSISFPTQPGHSYTCTVSGSSACGTAAAGTATFSCSIPTPTPTLTPTPTACPIPRSPSNVRITCPNCVN